MTRLTTDVDALNELFSSGVVALFGDLFTIIAITIWMLSENWRLALVTFTIVPAFVAITVWFRKGARDTYRLVRVRIARINAFLQEHITGMSVVQLFNREKKEMDRFTEINEDHRQANVRSVFYYAIFFPAIDIVSAIGVGLLVWYGGGQVVHKTLSLGALIAFLQLAQRFYNPIRDISEKYNILQSAMASSERIFKLLDTPLGVVSPAQPKRPPNWRGEIEFRNVWFAYNAEADTRVPSGEDGQDGIEWVLRDVSFKVNPGQSVAIVGHTGAGKTTITNLLLRFYDIQGGQILIDGVDIRDLELQDLRQNFSIVLQDVFLYTGDVASNIRLGNATISDDRVRFAAREVHADEFIQRLPEGYASQVRERGAGLSVGQKQLLAFARALAFDPRVLILDEATSSIDTETELLIRDALKRLMVGRTSIIIAHRLSTIQSCDKIIVMHKGQIREMGAHQELLALKGIYFRLYQLQYREQAVNPLTQLAGGD
jgi:ATP-binding cassette subfamily B protein